MCMTTKPIPMMPVIAITYFLPTAVEYRSSRKSLRLRDRLAVPETGPRCAGCGVIVCAIPRTLLVGMVNTEELTRPDLREREPITFSDGTGADVRHRPGRRALRPM